MCFESNRSAIDIDAVARAAHAQICLDQVAMGKHEEAVRQGEGVLLIDAFECFYQNTRTRRRSRHSAQDTHLR